MPCCLPEPARAPGRRWMWSTWAFNSLGRVSDERRIALVTGASSGIGEATVRALADGGPRHDLRRAAARAARGARRRGRRAGAAARRRRPGLRRRRSPPRSRSVDVIVHSAGGALGLEPIGDGGRGPLARDVGVERRRRDAGDQGAAARAAPGARPADRDHRLGRRGRGLRGRRRLHRRQARGPRARPDAAPGAARGRRSGLPRSRPAWSRPSSRWCASTATPSAPRASTTGWSR